MDFEMWYDHYLPVPVNHVFSCISVDDSPPGLVNRGVAFRNS